MLCCEVQPSPPLSYKVKYIRLNTTLYTLSFVLIPVSHKRIRGIHKCLFVLLICCFLTAGELFRLN